MDPNWRKNAITYTLFCPIVLNECQLKNQTNKASQTRNNRKNNMYSRHFKSKKIMRPFSGTLAEETLKEEKTKNYS